jgi:hypothetical protein
MIAATFVLAHVLLLVQCDSTGKNVKKILGRHSVWSIFLHRIEPEGGNTMNATFIALQGIYIRCSKGMVAMVTVSTRTAVSY